VTATEQVFTKFIFFHENIFGNNSYVEFDENLTNGLVLADEGGLLVLRKERVVAKTLSGAP
jgi:hypothetical protein